MTTNERLEKLKELHLKYESAIKDLTTEIATTEANFQKYSEEVKSNNKKCERRMGFAGLFLSLGTFLSTMVLPLTRGNIVAFILALSCLAFAGVNGVIQWRKSEKSDKQVEELKTLEIDNFNKILKLKENIAILEQKNNKVKFEIEKSTKELCSEKNITAKQIKSQSVSSAHAIIEK